MEAWIILSTVLAASLIYYFFHKKNYFEKHGILHMKPLPVFGNMAPTFFQRTSIADYIQKVYNLNSHAKYVGFLDFSYPIIVIRDPDLIKDIAIKCFNHFINHRGFVDPTEEPLLGYNLFSLRDSKWRMTRNIVSPAFTSSKMKGMFELMSECAANFVSYLAEHSEEKVLEINSKDAFARYTSDVIATCAFGISIDSMRNPNNEFYMMANKATDLNGIVPFAKFLFARCFPKFAKLLKIRLIKSDVADFFSLLIKDTIALRDEKKITRSDMIQLMMEARSNEDGQTSLFTIQEITAQAFTFFLGGFDTSSSVMSFTVHEIAANPHIQAKLQMEVDDVFKKYNEEPPYDVINGMMYLDAVIKESLRMYPIGAFLDRVCNEEFELPPALPSRKRLLLRPGDIIWIPVYPLHRDPKYYPNPDVFSPERFISDKQASTSSAPLFLPFGIGSRVCVGNRFALLEIKVVLAYIVRKCSIKPGKRMIVPLELSPSSFPMLAKGGFWLDIEPRRTSNTDA